MHSWCLYCKIKKRNRVAVTGVESLVYLDVKNLKNAFIKNFSPSSIDNVNISSKGY